MPCSKAIDGALQEPTSAVTPEIYKQALRQWATGVAIITTLNAEQRPVGFTASSLAALSLTPPWITFGLAHDATYYEAFRQASWIGVHILHQGQRALAERFAEKGVHRFAGLHWTPGAGGVPCLADALARMECRVAQRLPGGDHLLFIASVERVQVHQGLPLLYVQGHFRSL